MIYGAIVGLLLGQITWALNYWPLLPGLTGGLLLLLSFYLTVGIAQQGLPRTVSPAGYCLSLLSLALWRWR